MSLEKAEAIQEDFQLELNEILKENLDYKSEDQIRATKYILKSFEMKGKKLLKLITIIL